MDHIEEAKSIAWGKTSKILVPSGRIFIVRETNGGDDEILQNTETAREGMNVVHYLAGIIVKEVLPTGEKPVTVDEVKKFLVNDRTFLLIKLRILNLGEILKFSFNFGSDPKRGGEFKYAEDLSKYVFDYLKDFPEEEDEDYFVYRIPPYPEGAYEKFQLRLTSGKEVRMNLLNIEGEVNLRNMGPESDTDKGALKARNFEMKIDNEWVKVDSLKPFKPLDMVEIRKWFKEIDPTYTPITEVEHPRTMEVIPFNMLNSTDFFYPVEI